MNLYGCVFVNYHKKIYIPFWRTSIRKKNWVLRKSQLLSIQKLFKSDIRSMINFLQSNHELFDKSNHVCELYCNRNIMGEYYR